MSLRPQQPIPPVPDDTARDRPGGLSTGNPYFCFGTGSGRSSPTPTSLTSTPRLGQPAYAPWRLALVTLMQFREGLSDRQAAEAVRARIDWKYLLGARP